MGPVFAKLNQLWFLILALCFFSPPSAGQAQSHLTFCLKAALKVEFANYKTEKKFITKEPELQKKLSPGCAALHYDFALKGKYGIQVMSEVSGEIWGLDEKGILIKLHTTRSAIAASSAHGSAAPVASSAPDSLATFEEQSSQPGSSVAASPRGPLEGGDSLGAVAPPLAATSPGSSSTPPLAEGQVRPGTFQAEPPPNGPPAPLTPLRAVPIVGGDVDQQNKMERCFPKLFFRTTACVALFADIETKCSGPGPYPGVCAALKKSLTTLSLDNCFNPQDNFGRCEMRREQLEKKCANTLQLQSSDCREYNKYLVDLKDPNANGLSRLLDKIEKVTEFNANAPIPKPTFIDRAASSEPEREPAAALDEHSRQLANNLASGIQELVVMCKTTDDRQRAMLLRVQSIEKETELTKTENRALRERLDAQVKDLESIKTKLGIK